MFKGTLNRFILSGDAVAAKRYAGAASSQMEILKNQMAFQGLSQGVRRVWLNQDTHIECSKCFDIYNCKIWCRPEEEDVLVDDQVTEEVEFVLKPTFNGCPAVLGGQCIAIEYQVGDNTKVIWVEIYGTYRIPPDTTIEKCSRIISLPVEEISAFKNTAKCYLRSKAPDRYGHTPEGATFSTFYEVQNPEPTTILNEIHYKYDDNCVGEGDGTVSPKLWQMWPVRIPVIALPSGQVRDFNGFSLSREQRIKVRTTDTSGNFMYLYLNSAGFMSGSSDASQGQFNTTTGEFDIPIVWDRPVLVGARIDIDFYERPSADIRLGDWSSTTFMKEVDKKEASNTFNTAPVTKVSIKGKEIDAYQIEFDNLYILKRVPDTYTKENQAYTCWYGFLTTTNLWGQATEDNWGAYPSSSINSRYTLGIPIPFKADSGLVVTVEKPVSGDIADGLPSCLYQRLMVITQERPTDRFLGITTDSRGNNPSLYDPWDYSIDEWLDYQELGFYPDDPRGGCFNTLGVEYQDDPDDLVPEGTCGVNTWSWTYEMVSTPAEAF